MVLVMFYPNIYQAKRLKYDEYAKFKNGLGLCYSNMTGSGITYYRTLNKDFQFKSTNFLYYKRNDEKTDSMIFLGAEVDRFFFKSDYFRSYFLGGVAYSMEEDSSADDSIDRKWHFGTGIGLEVFSSEHFRINLDLGYQYYHNYTKDKEALGFGFGIGSRFVF